MTETEFVQVARQPIIDATNDIYGYELYHRDNSGVHIDTTLSRKTLSAQVILSVYNLIGRERSVGDALAFFNIDPEFLDVGIIEALPHEQCIFEIDARRPMLHGEVLMLKELYAKGYRFALDNFAITANTLDMHTEALPFIECIKVDVQSSDVEYIAEHIERFKNRYTLIAQRIESIDEFSAYKDIGFSYFQGYYIQHPLPVKHYRMEPKHLGLTRLFKMLDTVTFDEYAAEFERHNELTVQFFQYLISSRQNQYDATRSVRDLIMDVGPDIMHKWMMLIVYAKGSKEIEEPKSSFSLFFEQRYDLMEVIVSNVHSADQKRRSDELKLLTVFSTLIDLYQVPYEALTNAFRVSKNLELWIFSRKGRFSLLYKAINQLQHTPLDVEKVNRILKAFKTDYSEVSDKMHRAI